jgi:hypothetical protein
MAKKILGLGTTPNDHAGDSLRVAGGKINDNFTELYDALGVNGSLTVATVAKTGSYNDLSGIPRVAPALVAVPLSATANGTIGDIAFDQAHLYVCTNTNTWKRVSLATW